MLYYLFTYLDQAYDIPGASVFQYITFRAAMAVITSLIISMLFGKRLIDRLQRLQVGETVRDLGLEGQTQKAGTPTMGGVIIILAIVVPTLLWAKLDNIYILLMLISTLWMGAIGFLDDYIKVFKKDKILDTINVNAFKAIETEIKKDNSIIAEALIIFSVVKKLERVGDLIKNVAEEIIFYIDAEIIKHQRKK